MNYELAKKLKETGFSQENREYYYGCGYAFNTKTIYELHHNSEKLPLRTWLQYVACPTLSELIEACGEEYIKDYEFLLAVRRGKWFANFFDGEFEPCELPNGEGSTPEEAVANLWLALNEDKKILK